MSTGTNVIVTAPATYSIRALAAVREPGVSLDDRIDAQVRGQAPPRNSRMATAPGAPAPPSPAPPPAPPAPIVIA